MRFRKLMIYLLVLFLLPASAFAEWGAEPPKKEEKPGRLRALLIGCDHFVTQEDTWPAAENNLRLLSDTLVKDVRRYALIRSQCGVLSDVEAFEQAVLSTFQNAQPEDVSLLYISTHGKFEEGKSNADAGLILSDGQKETLLDAASLQRILDQVPGKKLVILDACNSGAVIGKGLSGGADRHFLTGGDYKVICSAGGSEASWYFQHGTEAEAAGASYFATVLSYGLGANGDHGADRNADGLISLSEVYDYLCDNYAASTPHIYPQNDQDFVVFAYDAERPEPVEQAVTDIIFEETLLTAGESNVTFSFTVRRQVELYYQIVYHQNGQWQFDSAQHFLDGEQADGTVLPGRKQRTLSLNTGKEDAYGYAIVQLITKEDGKPVFQGARLICVQPSGGDFNLKVLTSSSFLPQLGQETEILIQHDRPCSLTVSIVNEEGRTVYRLGYETPSRPQQLTPQGSVFYWDGRMNDGQIAPPGKYRAQVRVRLNGVKYIAESDFFDLLPPWAENQAATDE